MGDPVPRDVLSSRGIDRVLHVVSHRQRRLILYMLRRGEPVSEAGLQVRGTNDGDGHSGGLRHVHLPKLAETGYVDWDRDTGTIEKGPAFDELEPLLDLIENHSAELPPNWP